MLHDGETVEIEWVEPLDSNTCAAVYSLAFHAYENGRYQEALPLFRFLTVHHPLIRKHWMGLGATYQMMKNPTEALSCYEIAAIQESNDPFVHLHAADCLFALDKIPEALVALGAAESVATGNEKYRDLLQRLKLMQNAWNRR